MLINAILISTDGGEWTPQPTPLSILYDVTYGNGLFVAVGEGGAILTSRDGRSWTEQSSGTNYPLFDATYGNGLFVVVGSEGTILTSRDGVNWTWRSLGDDPLHGVTYGNGLFVAVGDGNTIFTSPNGVNWAKRVSQTGNPSHAYAHLLDLLGLEGRFARYLEEATP
jgi:photosystem II stability/assembly factor-like uncharacterized protein